MRGLLLSTENPAVLSRARIDSARRARPRARFISFIAAAVIVATMFAAGRCDAEQPYMSVPVRSFHHARMHPRYDPQTSATAWPETSFRWGDFGVRRRRAMLMGVHHGYHRDYVQFRFR